MKKTSRVSSLNIFISILGFIAILFLFTNIVSLHKPRVAGVTGAEGETGVTIVVVTHTPIPATKAPTPVPTKKPVATKTIATQAPTLTPTPTSIPAVETTRIYVVRSDNKSIANTQVLIDDKTYTLDENSSVEIPNIDLGNHNVKADLDNKEVSKGFVLGEKDLLNDITVVLPIDTSIENTFDYSWLYLCLILILILLIIALILFFIRRKKKDEKKKEKQNPKKKRTNRK